MAGGGLCRVGCGVPPQALASMRARGAGAASGVCRPAGAGPPPMPRMDSGFRRNDGKGCAGAASGVCRPAGAGPPPMPRMDSGFRRNDGKGRGCGLGGLSAGGRRTPSDAPADSGCPGWIPAFAGMTERGARAASGVCRPAGAGPPPMPRMDSGFRRNDGKGCAGALGAWCSPIDRSIGAGPEGAIRRRRHLPGAPGTGGVGAQPPHRRNPRAGGWARAAQRARPGWGCGGLSKPPDRGHCGLRPLPLTPALSRKGRGGRTGRSRVVAGPAAVEAGRVACARSPRQPQVANGIAGVNGSGRTAMKVPAPGSARPAGDPALGRWGRSPPSLPQGARGPESPRGLGARSGGGAARSSGWGRGGAPPSPAGARGPEPRSRSGMGVWGAMGGGWGAPPHPRPLPQGVVSRGAPPTPASGILRRWAGGVPGAAPAPPHPLPLPQGARGPASEARCALESSGWGRGGAAPT